MSMSENLRKSSGEVGRILFLVFVGSGARPGQWFDLSISGFGISITNALIVEVGEAPRTISAESPRPSHA